MKMKYCILFGAVIGLAVGISQQRKKNMKALNDVLVASIGRTRKLREELNGKPLSSEQYERFAEDLENYGQ